MHCVSYLTQSSSQGCEVGSITFLLLKRKKGSGGKNSFLQTPRKYQPLQGLNQGLCAAKPPSLLPELPFCSLVPAGPPRHHWVTPFPVLLNSFKLEFEQVRQMNRDEQPKRQAPLLPSWLWPHSRNYALTCLRIWRSSIYFHIYKFSLKISWV